MFYSNKVALKVDFFAVIVLVVTLNFDRLTSKSNQFMFVHDGTKVLNLAKFPKQFIIRYRVQKLITHGRTDSLKS